MWDLISGRLGFDGDKIVLQMFDLIGLLSVEMLISLFFFLLMKLLPLKFDCYLLFITLTDEFL